VTGDPHFSGPNGEKFDFAGQASGVYTLLASKRYVVTMRLDDVVEGVEVRFIKEIGVTVGNVTVTFDTAVHNNDFLENLAAKLIPVGANASYTGGSSYAVAMDVCPGQRIVIVQEFTTPEWEHIAHIATNMYYLNIEFLIAGCHDDFDGIVGQMYQCRFFDEKNPFVWDGRSEEIFRAPTLSTISGAFAANGLCVDKRDFGAPSAGPAFTNMRPGSSVNK